MVKLTVILATLALVLTLAACGGDPTATPTLEPTPTPTATSSPIPTATATATPTPTSTPTATPTATARPVPTPTATATPTLTPTPTRTPRPTATPTPTRTPTPTPVPTPTTQPTGTPTPTRIGADDPENFPPFPNIYSGGVLVGGQSAPNGTPIFARIGNYQTPSVGVIDGRYSQLTAGPGSIFFYGLTITFHTIVNEVELQAAETAIFREVKFDVVPPRNFFNTVDLTFPSP